MAFARFPLEAQHGVIQDWIQLSEIARPSALTINQCICLLECLLSQSKDPKADLVPYLSCRNLGASHHGQIEPVTLHLSNASPGAMELELIVNGSPTYLTPRM